MGSDLELENGDAYRLFGTERMGSERMRENGVRS